MPGTARVNILSVGVGAVAVTGIYLALQILNFGLIFPNLMQGGIGDSPILVRGGSLEFQSVAHGWTNNFTVSQTSPTHIYFQDYQAKTVPLANTTKNWKIALNFRMTDGNGRGDQEVDICSAPGCSQNGAVTDNNTVYVYENKLGTLTLEAAGSDHLQHMMHYHVNECGTGHSGADSPCDHGSQVTLTVANVVSKPLVCTRGWCDIGISDK